MRAATLMIGVVAMMETMHLLEDDPTLEPPRHRGLCPDIEAYAPLIQATFGGHDLNDGSKEPAHKLEIRLADRSLRQTNPVMGVLAEVLELGHGADHCDGGPGPGGPRAGAPPVPLRRRGPVPAGGVGGRGVCPLGVRRGTPELVPARGHRDQHLAVRLGPDPPRGGHGGRAPTPVRGHPPLDDVDSTDIDLAGRMSEFLDRLRRALDVLAGSRAVDAWAETLAAISDSLTATSVRDAWQRAELNALLDALVGEATTGEVTSPVVLNCDDVQSILNDRLKGRPTRANFCTGHLTVCTLVPMRSIPHRVVCLLGLDDGSFPRHIERDGDDLTSRNQKVGDRDVKERGPAAAARRSPRRSRPPGGDLLGARRALQPATTSRRAGGRAARCGGPHRAHVDAPCP